MHDLRHWMRLCEAVEYADYGYWVKPDGEALVVPDSSHSKVLRRHYTGDAHIMQDRYEEIIAEGWCWVHVSGMFTCFIEPSALTRQSLATLLRIVSLYVDFTDYRIVYNGREKRDFTTAMATKAFLRSLLQEAGQGATNLAG